MQVLAEGLGVFNNGSISLGLVHTMASRAPWLSRGQVLSGGNDKAGRNVKIKGRSAHMADCCSRHLPVSAVRTMDLLA